MNYGDGLYGGNFVAGMYAEAFFEKDPRRLVLAGLKCIPEESQYAECIRDVLRWHQESPDDWKATWNKVNEKYHLNPDYRRFSCSKGEFNIDAKINGAFIVMGLLFGDGDLDRTIIISTRCGQDSDCNPSNAAGILFTALGMDEIPERFTKALDPETKFSHTNYNFHELVAVCEKLAREAVVLQGGKIIKNAEGLEVFHIPPQSPDPGPLRQCWDPEPPRNLRFSEEEMERIRFEPQKD
jgi:hypothetical protein